MPGFERTKQAADLFAKLISCANPQCSQESDQLQTLGTACKHAFCWDCINTFSRLDTFTLCPRCACPLDIHRPRAAQVFNNLAQHINEFKVLLLEYEQALRNEGAGAAATLAQTQRLFQAYAGDAEDVDDKAARNEAIDEFISTQRVPNSKPEADPEEEKNDVITDSVPQFDQPMMTSTQKPSFEQPMMTSTQKPSLFLSQALHARNEIFQHEPTQEVKVYRDEKVYNNFRVKPTNTFDARRNKMSDDRWLKLPDKPQKITKGQAAEDCVRDEDVRTPKRGTKVEAKYDVNRRDNQLRTPLFIAVEMKRLDICKVLVENGGAIINANCGAECNTALHIAVAQESEDIVRYLLSKGASKTICNIRQQTPSHLAQIRSPLRSLVEHYRSHPRQPCEMPTALLVPHGNPASVDFPDVARLPDIYIVCFSRDIRKSLTYGDQAALHKIMTVVEFCDEATTHYVVSADADGVASVDADLLRAMMQCYLNYTHEPGLFHGCIFYLLAKKYKGIDDRRLLPDLVRLGGGEIISREPDYKPGLPAPFHSPKLSSPIFIVYDVTLTKHIPEKFMRQPKHYNMVSAQWIIESVMEYAIKSIA
ncbi:unnamed protein product [Heligmosomoides polygyrus]|uniref:ANK_REP_REGION domain-containing protein n=1 Tax=Heligmosomoides polygyrus TaxID=6339 RepID=A0A183GFH9_HELPZ|nr:unnamed protein product [Heligmosomoides polygyrus]